MRKSSASKSSSGKLKINLPFESYMVRLNPYLCSCGVQSNKHCGVISRRIFKIKVSLERFCNALNEMRFFVVVIGLRVWAFETKKNVFE